MCGWWRCPKDEAVSFKREVSEIMKWIDGTVEIQYHHYCKECAKEIPPPKYINY